MKYDIVNKYSDAYVLNQPLCQTPFQVDALLAHLRSAVSSLFPRDKFKNHYNEALMAITLFQRFLQVRALKEVTPNESMFEEFRNAIKVELKRRTQKAYSDNESNRNVDFLRRLFNEYLFPRKLILRRILKKQALLKYKRFLSLSDQTQKAIVEFEKDGRAIKACKKYFANSSGPEYFEYHVQRTASRLSDYNRKQRIGCALTLLSILGKNNVEDLSAEDLERFRSLYIEKNKKDLGSGYLSALFSIVSNGICLGILKKNPFHNFLLEKRKKKSREDFVMPEGIGKLLDLGSLNWEDANEVRGRCLTALIFDTALRASAMTMLKVDDIQELPDGIFKLTARGEYLKGDKNDKVFYILFRQTVALLKHWIRVVRPKLKPQVNHLFVSLKGKPLKIKRIEEIVCSCGMTPNAIKYVFKCNIYAIWYNAKQKQRIAVQ